MEADSSDSNGGQRRPSVSENFRQFVLSIRNQWFDNRNLENNHGHVLIFDKIRFDKIDKFQRLDKKTRPDFLLVYKKTLFWFNMLFVYSHVATGSGFTI